jgi:ribosomal protein S12 methylthiotransferase accessory factor
MDMKIYSGRGKQVLADHERFTIRTDQPVEDGGEGSAPEPFTLFLASLGTCAAHYVFSYCARRDLPIDGISLMQRVERDKKTKMIERVILEIRIPDGIPEKHWPAMVRAAQLCTVKKQLNSSIDFKITTRGGIA